MHQPSRFIRSTRALGALCLIAGLAGCGGDDGSTIEAGTTGGVIIPLGESETSATSATTANAASNDTGVPAGTTASVTPTGAAPEVTTGPTTDTTLNTTLNTTAAAAGSCLIGDWSVADSEVAMILDRSAGSVFNDVVASGQLDLSFTASSYTWTQSARIAFTVDYDSAPTPATFSQDRVITGSWSANSSTISAGNLAFDGDYVITENGVEPDDTGDLFLGVLPYDPVDGTSYSCEGPTLNLRLNDFSADTFPVTLQRR